MLKLKQDNHIYMLLSIILVVGGYWFLRYAYHVVDKAPFSQEYSARYFGYYNHYYDYGDSFK